MSLLAEGQHVMTSTQWGELIGAVVTVLISLAGYLKSRDAHARSMRVAQRVTKLEIATYPPPQVQVKSQVAEAENAADNPG